MEKREREFEKERGSLNADKINDWQNHNTQALSVVRILSSPSATATIIFQEI